MLCLRTKMSLSSPSIRWANKSKYPLSQAFSSIARPGWEIAYEFVAAARGPSAPSQQGSTTQYSVQQPRIEQGDGRHTRTGVTVPTRIQWRAELGELPALIRKAWEALNDH